VYGKEIQEKGTYKKRDKKKQLLNKTMFSLGILVKKPGQ
jgi:hypothetical protein